MDFFVYASLVILSGFVVWMVFQFIKEWPSYSRKRPTRQKGDGDNK